MKKLSEMSLADLKRQFEEIAEEYRRRINVQWDMDLDYSWWIPTDRPGETLALNDLEVSLSFSDVQLFVNLNVSCEEFTKWWCHVLENENPINAYSWFVFGARPKDFKNDR